MRISTLCLLLLVPCGIYAQAVEPLHIYDERPLSTCSSAYKKEIIDDAQAHGGKAVRFTGQAGFISLHDEIAITPGKYRFTVRARLEKGGRFVTGLEVAGQEYFNRVVLDFGAIPADGSYVERSVELYLPANIRVVSLRDNLPEELIVDNITLTPVPNAGPVEVMAVQAGKLVYGPKEAGTATVFLMNYAGKEQAARLRLVLESGLHDARVVREQDVALPAGTQMQKVTVPLPVLPEWGYTLRAEVLLDGTVASVSRDTFAVSAHPQQVGQYGIFSGGDQYEAGSADTNVRNFRNTYATFAQICFWAPCEETPQISMVSPELKSG